MTEELCDPCSRDDVQANATTVCTDCEEFLCDDCTRAHRRNKLSLAHVLLDVKQIGSLPQSTVSSQTFCDVHQTTTLDFYCPQHEKTCCRSCMVDVHRTCDRVIPLSEASKNIKSDPIIDKLSAEIENLISISDKLLQNGDDNIQEMRHQESAIHAQISQRKSKIIENFDKEEKALYEDLTTGKKKVQERVQDQEIKVESIRTEILKYNQELDFVERHASNIQGYLQLRNVKDNLHQQSNGLHTVLSKITNLSVKYDSKTNLYVNSLGDVQLDVTPCPIVYRPLDGTQAAEESSINEEDEVANSILEIPISEIKRDMQIKTGQFVEIWKGSWRSLGTKQKKVVAVKMAKENTDDATRYVMNRANILAICDHANIIHLYGICSGPPTSMIIEYMSLGNLLQFLRNLQEQSNLITEQLEDLTSIAVQICSGMDYINSKRIVHTDLSAKNVMIGDGKVAKIIGFGMAKKMDQDVLKMEKPFSVVVKWTAPEVVLDKTISIFSDVWSFGIVMVEMMTFGGEPYPGIKKQDIINLVKGGYRHAQPEGCPDVVYHVLLRCWSEDPNERPTFGFLYNFFDTVTVINEGNQEDEHGSTGSEFFNDDNSSAGSYNDIVAVPERKNGDLEEDMLPKQKSKNRKKQSKEKEKCTLS